MSRRVVVYVGSPRSEDQRGCQKLQQEGGSICAKEVRVAQSLLYTSFTDTSSFVPIRSAGDEKEETTYSEHYERRGL
jgi:predicted Rossmann fold nucleotide-binding protein DprA/Smf involved in DNA uptake